MTVDCIYGYLISLEHLVLCEVLPQSILKRKKKRKIGSGSSIFVFNWVLSKVPQLMEVSKMIRPVKFRS